MTLRVLFTSSQRWDHAASVFAIAERLTTFAFTWRGHLTVIHGDCGRGGDRLLRAWCTRQAARGWPVAQEPYPCDWEAPCAPPCPPGEHRRRRRDGRLFCPRKGMWRNRHMVSLGADVCLGLVRDGSPGATGCTNMAQTARIHTGIITWEQRHDAVSCVEDILAEWAVKT